MFTRRVTRFGVPFAAAFAVALAVPRAQQPAPSPAPPPASAAQPVAQGPTFKSSIDSVVVDVGVSDKQGRSVADLTRDDFEVREAGKLQTISSFKYIKTDDGLDDPDAARDILSMSDQERETAREDNRLFVIFLDDYHVRRANSMTVREQVAKFLRTLTPHDLVAISTPESQTSAITFSRDHDAMAANVLGFVGRKYEYQPMNAMEQRYQDLPPEQIEIMRNNLTIAALSNVCQFMGGLRDGRKSILLVSEGMSGSMPVGVRTIGTFTPSMVTAQSGSQTFFDNAALLLDIQTKVFSEASRNNVAVYTLDPRGLANFEFSVGEDVSPQDDQRIIQETVDQLRVVADQTGGRAIVNRNDPTAALQQMVRDSSAYYLLGYTSSLAPRDGKFHEIQVRVKRRDVDVRARKGYWAYSPDDIAAMTAPPKAAPPSEVSGAIDSLASAATTARSKPVAAWMGAERGASEKATVTLAWAVSPATSSDPLDMVDHVTIDADSAGGTTLYEAKAPRPSADGTAVVTFQAPPGPVHVRLTAENARGVRVDSTEASVDVPDFTSAGPQLTTPFLYRGRTARDLQQVRTAASPAPVVTPVFSRTERLLIRFGAYGPAGTTPTVTMRLLNGAGNVIAALPAPTKASASLLESEIGLVAFPPGDYVIEIAAESGGQTTKQLVAIRVTG